MSNSIDSIVNKEFFKNIEDIIIMPNSKGGYDIFNKYRLIKSSKDISIYDSSQEKYYRFNYLKNAFIWCILDKHFLIVDSKRLQELDITLASLNTTIEHQNKIISKKNKQDKEILRAKIRENIHKRALVIEECQTLELRARILQSKKFDKR